MFYIHFILQIIMSHKHSPGPAPDIIHPAHSTKKVGYVYAVLLITSIMKCCDYWFFIEVLVSSRLMMLPVMSASFFLNTGLRVFYFTLKAWVLRPIRISVVTRPYCTFTLQAITLVSELSTLMFYLDYKSKLCLPKKELAENKEIKDFNTLWFWLVKV